MMPAHGEQQQQQQGEVDDLIGQQQYSRALATPAACADVRVQSLIRQHELHAFAGSLLASTSAHDGQLSLAAHELQVALSSILDARTRARIAWVTLVRLADRLDRAYAHALVDAIPQDTSPASAEDDRLLQDINSWRGRLAAFDQLFPDSAAPVSVPCHVFLRVPLRQLALELAATSHLAQLLSLLERHHNEHADAAVALTHVPLTADPAQFTLLASHVLQQRPDEDSKLVTALYMRRISDSHSLGLVAHALKLVQLAPAALATVDNNGLDELGEDLTFLSKFVYDRPWPDSPAALANLARRELDDTAKSMTLDRWRALPPERVLTDLLAWSTFATIVGDVRQLALPFLDLVEIKGERLASEPAAPNLASRLLLRELATRSASTNGLEALSAVFSASKPTLPLSQRVIRSDHDLARLALAVAYGHRAATTADDLVLLSSIFECLPALESSTDSSRSLFSIESFGSAVDLLDGPLAAFEPADLSAALDLLDSHLSQAEMLSRYSVPTPLTWFLRSADDEAAQRALATRLARTSSQGGAEPGQVPFESEDEWEALLDDMIAMCAGEQGTASQRKALAKLGPKEVMRIFFGGLLASGHQFSLARRLLQEHAGAQELDAAAQEQLVVDTARELYDNAESGNMNSGNMKLAYECLAVVAPTPAIRKEREFIEATSRLCSFRLFSQPGVPMTPIEIRLSRDRLELIARLLESNQDVYQHPDMLLEITAKLGGHHDDELAQIKVLAMSADAAIKRADYERAGNLCDRMAAKVEATRRRRSLPEQSMRDAADVAWTTCFDLGRNAAYSNSQHRLRILGLAMTLCPPEQLAKTLSSWMALDAEAASETARPPSLAIYAVPRGRDTTAAAAARSISGLFSPSPQPSPVRSEFSSPPPSELSTSAGKTREGFSLSRGLDRGIGWLIGAPEDM